MPLEDALARIPGLAGYLGQEQFTQRQNAGTLDTLTKAQTLQSHFAAAAKERGLREALAGLPQDATDEQRLAAITPFVGADKAFSAIESKQARKLTADNTRELQNQRLDQKLQMFNAEMDRLKIPEAQRRQAQREFMQRHIAGNDAYLLPADILQKYQMGVPPAAAPAPAAAPQQVPPAATPPPAGFPPRAQVQPGAARGGDPAPIRFTPAEEAENTADLQSPESRAALQQELARKDLPAPARAILQAELARIDAAPAATPAPAEPVATPTALPVQGAPVARGEVPPAQGAPVARGLPTPPPELEAAWAKLGRKGADMARARWLAGEAVKGTNRDVPGDFTKTGAEYLASLPVSDREVVKKIANYEIDPKTLETRGGQRSRMLSMVSQFDPTYDDTQYANKRRAITQFGSGPLGNIARSQNVAIEHMDTLQRAADALKNGDFTPGNKAYNEVAKLFGSAPPNTFEAMRDIVANEVVKGTIGTSGAVEDRSQAAAKIKAAASPEQFKKLIAGWTELMGGQVKGLERQYEGATKLKDFRERYLTQRARDAIGLAERQAGGGSAAPDGALQMLRSNPTIPMKEAFKKKYGYLPDGI